MPLIGAEAAAASLAAFLSSAILSAYLADRIGFAIAPFAILPVAAAIAAAVWLWLGRRATSDRRGLRRVHADRARHVRLADVPGAAGLPPDRHRLRSRPSPRASRLPRTARAPPARRRARRLSRRDDRLHARFPSAGRARRRMAPPRRAPRRPRGGGADGGAEVRLRVPDRPAPDAGRRAARRVRDRGGAAPLAAVHLLRRLVHGAVVSLAGGVGAVRGGDVVGARRVERTAGRRRDGAVRAVRCRGVPDVADLDRSARADARLRRDVAPRPRRRAASAASRHRPAADGRRRRGVRIDPSGLRPAHGQRRRLRDLAWAARRSGGRSSCLPSRGWSGRRPIAAREARRCCSPRSRCRARRSSSSDSTAARRRRICR